jgi:DNA invertase Pin-like site-specific DNA recombinase
LKIGYARTSTTEQVAGLDAQKKELEAAGCQEVFFEQVSSVQKRNELDKLLRFIRKGDALVVTKLDRLARSIPDLVKIVETLESKDAPLTILDMNLDTSSPTGKLLLNLVGSIAQFEREIMLQRQREGISVAKAEGRYKGRKPTARSKSDQVFDLHDRGVPAAEIADQLKISRASTYRILAAKRDIQGGSKTIQS